MTFLIDADLLVRLQAMNVLKGESGRSYIQSCGIVYPVKLVVLVQQTIAYTRHTTHDRRLVLPVLAVLKKLQTHNGNFISLKSLRQTSRSTTFGTSCAVNLIIISSFVAHSCTRTVQVLVRSTSIVRSLITFAYFTYCHCVQNTGKNKSTCCFQPLVGYR
jgi:hypothetical protein